MRKDRVVIVGAGVGGLASAMTLAARGLDVTVIERGSAPGGKMRQVALGSAHIDSGPTVFTMRWVFDELFADADENFTDHVSLQPLQTLARHAWSANERLDLFADEERTVDAIGDFAGRAEAERYRSFCRDSRRIYKILEKPFLRSARPSMGALLGHGGLRGLMDLPQIQPFTTMWAALGKYFHDPRLRQMFGRYATYCGSSPFDAPATLMLVAHVEREGVWRIGGGMHALAQALADCATKHGATFRYNTEVSEIVTTSGRISGIMLKGGERLAADAVVMNSDVSALVAGLFGKGIVRGAPAIPPRARSLSAVTWSMMAKTDGFLLGHHSVFFSRNYRAEFDDIFGRNAPPTEPTVYVCAQDRDDDSTLATPGSERLLILINAPPTGDHRTFTESDIDRCTERTFATLKRCGLEVDAEPGMMRVTTPFDFDALFPATGGALYGRSSHGWAASFQRPGVRTKIPGLYLAGGSAHPGPGVPMAALSGRAAAASLIADLATESSPSRRREG